MNILSIDWDYFFKLAKEDDYFIECMWHEYYCCVDRKEINPKKLTEAHIWKKMYELRPHLNQVEFRHSEFALLFQLLKKQPRNIRCFITDNHASAYRFINSYGCCKSTIYNVDYHHDVYNHALKYLNCGNWLLKLKQESKINNIWWINGGKKGRPKNNIGKLPHINSIMDIKFNGIFLCKSKDYSLPMYDKKFLQLASFLMARFPKAKCANCTVFMNRWAKILAA